MTQRELSPGRSLIEDLTRREFVFSALGAALLIACGDDEDGETPDTNATREFIDSTGRAVQVPAVPKRIVSPTAPHWGAAQVLSLGFPVVAMSSWEGDWPPDYVTRYFETGTIKGLGWDAETDIETVVTLAPDLIVCSATNGKNDIDPTVLARLEAIAPVVAIDPKRQVEDVMADYVRLLGADASVLDRQKAEFESVMDEIRDLLGDGWSKVTVASMWAGDESLEAWGPDGLAMNAIISRLGVQWNALSEEAATTDFDLLDVSMERMSEFDCDLLLYGNVYQDISDNSLFKQLGVVRAGQVVAFPDFTFDGTHYPNYIASARYILEALKGMSQPLRTDIV